MILSTNATGGNPMDCGLDFLYGREQASGFKKAFDTIKSIYTFPERIIITLFGASSDDWQWVITIINGFVWLGIVIAFILFVRGIFIK